MVPVKFLTVAILALVSVANGTRCTNKVTKFQTFDPYIRKLDVVPAPDGGPAVIHFDWFTPYCKFTIIAVTESTPPGCDEAPIGCVEISLGDYSHKERVPPYTLYGDDHGDANFRRPDGAGIYTLKACPFTDSRCTRGKGTCLEFDVEIRDDYVNNFILFDAALNWGPSWMGYVPYQGSMCYPQSGQVTMVAVANCFVNKVDFLLTGGGRKDVFTDHSCPFFLYGDDGNLPYPVLNGRDGFEVGTEYTVSAILDDDPSTRFERRVTFVNC